MKYFPNLLDLLYLSSVDDREISILKATEQIETLYQAELHLNTRTLCCSLDRQLDNSLELNALSQPAVQREQTISRI